MYTKEEKLPQLRTIYTNKQSSAIQGTTDFRIWKDMTGRNRAANIH